MGIQTINPTINKVKSILVVFLATTIILCLGGCSPKHNSYSDFYEFPQKDGWQRKSPVTLDVQYPDSLAQYEISIALSHDNYYPYRNIWLYIDFMDKDGKNIKRDSLNCNLADKFGKWNSSGFGSIYQYERVIANRVNSNTINKIIVWQGMRDDTLSHISNIGIISRPITSK